MGQIILPKRIPFERIRKLENVFWIMLSIVCFYGARIYVVGLLARMFTVEADVIKVPVLGVVDLYGGPIDQLYAILFFTVTLVPRLTSYIFGDLPVTLYLKKKGQV